MTNKKPRKSGRQRNISVRSVRRTEVDAKRLSRALINYALLQAAEEAAAQKSATNDSDSRKSGEPEDQRR